MNKTISKVGVIGAGTMGAGIAGQVANAGIPVVLLDIPSGASPNALAQRGVDRLNNPDMPGLINKEAEALIQVGNIDDDFELLADCDWVAEAIVEKLELKQALYKRLLEQCKAETIISSNTSTIPIKLLTQGMPKSFCQRFAITHFFNPVRFMRLLELVRGEQTTDEVINTLDHFCENALGKGVVPCDDKPGFLANRVGVFALQCAMKTAFEIQLTAAEADAVFGRPFGFPKTGVFGLYDLIGIDLMADVASSLSTILPANDRFHHYSQPLPFVKQMISNGQIGNKNDNGFYKGTGIDRKVIDFQNGGYQPFQRIRSALLEDSEINGPSELIQSSGKYAEFAWQVISEVLCYAATLLPEVTNNPADIDDAMKLGYNWTKGPFELLDQIGHEYFVSRLKEEGRAVPEFLHSTLNSPYYKATSKQLQTLCADGHYHAIVHSPNILRFSETRQTFSPSGTNEAASWFEYKEAAIVEFHSKANALDELSLNIIIDAINTAENKGLRGVVIHNDAQHFSCGVSLWRVRECFEANDYERLDNFLKHFQDTMIRMRSSSLPVVAAPVGMSIGGGFEVVLHTDQIIANTNSVMGLVESGVGLIPGGGGCKEVLHRWYSKLQNSEQASWNAFMNIGIGKLSNAPQEAENLAFVEKSDTFHVNRDHMLKIALDSLDTVPKTPMRGTIELTGKPSYNKMKAWLEKNFEKGFLTPHDCTIGDEIAQIVTGGNCEPGTLATEQDLFDFERQSFLRLARSKETQERITNMLDFGQVTRN